jgi:ArsR family transcriptional regulator, arsenate/arsenite/antimonite-responsive transcriptional repressor
MDLDMSTPLPMAPAIHAAPHAARIAELAKALGEPVRVSIVDVLRRSVAPVCQCELVPLFDMPQSTLSHHLKKLADAGLVDVERRHKWAYYSLNPDVFEELTAWLT